MMEHSTFSHQRIGYLIVVVIMSFVSGLVGGIVGQKDYQEQVNLLNFSDITEKIKEQVSKDVEPADLLLEMTPSIAEIYLHGDSVVSQKNKKEGVSALDALTGGATFQGYALAITSDGWLVAVTQSLSDDASKISLVTSDGTVYVPEKKIDDKATGLSFIKTGARNMKPVSITQNILTGYPQEHFYIENKTTIAPITITSPGYANGLASKSLLTTTSLSKTYNFTSRFGVIGSPIVTKNKEVVGIASQQGIIPLSYVRDILIQVLRSGVVTRAELPVTYIDRAWWTAPLKDPQYKDLKSGAIIVSDKKIILRGSQASVTLSNGDVIVAVNQEKLDASRGLAEIIQQYHSGDAVTLTVLQSGTQKTYSVILE